jgi:hypothetical protein
LTDWEDPGGEPPSAATSAQAVDAGRVPELKAALLLEQGRQQELVLALAREQGHAVRLSRSHSRAARRFDAKVKAVARQNLTVGLAAQEEYDRLGRDLGRVRDLERERDRAEAQVQASEQALERVRSNVQALERTLALAMAQARTLAREQARSPRLRAIAVTRFIGRLLQGRSGLWDGIVRNLYLGMRVVAVLAWMLPKADRTRWRNESFSELQDLKMEGVPLLGDAFRIAARTPWLALVLWTGVWRRSPAARWLPRLKPLWIGLGTAAVTFLGGAAGIGQSPTGFQMRALVGASLLTGALAITGSYKGRRPRRRRRKR